MFSGCFNTVVSHGYRVQSTNPRSNPILQEYILPDFSVHRRGRVRRSQEPLEDSFQILYMNHERFTVPEILFKPDDIGAVLLHIRQMVAYQ